MKKIMLVLALLGTGLLGQAQLGNVLDRAKKKAEDKVNKKVDDTVDRDTGDKKSGDDKKSEDDTTKEHDKKSDNPTENAPAGIKVYSKYDFLPGEKVIGFEDFSAGNIGDFPEGWNTNASAEIVTIESLPGKWLKISKQGVFMPEFIDSLPENSTLEYDLLCDNPGRVWGFYTTLAALEDRNRPELWQSSKSRFTFTVAAQPNGNSTSSIERSRDGVGESSMQTGTKQFSDKTNPVHVAIWRQKERIRVYFNQEKVWDLPKVMSPGSVYNGIVYWLQGGTDDGNFYLSNLRLAVGMSDTRKKILEQNKWVTHGILFDVNSASIKPESYGTLKEMASVLKENADLKVKIVGHTDSDGSDAANLELSKRRSAAVKAMLAKEFSIEESRMETDGKGESEPIDKNDTPAGKANNRRVEFIKI